MKIKSKTDVITNSSTEVFICGPKEGITFEELKKKIPFFRLIQFSYDRYKEWVKSLKDAMKKAEEGEEEDWVYEDSYQAPGFKDDENNMYQEIWCACPDPINKNKVYWDTLLNYLFDPKVPEIAIKMLEWDGKQHEYKYYPELETPTPLIQEFRDYVVGVIQKVKDIVPDPEKPWEKNSKENFLRTYTNDEGKPWFETDRQKDFLYYSARFNFADYGLMDWLEEHEKDFPPFDEILKTNSVKIPTTPDDLDGDCIDFWADDCSNPSDKDWKKIEELTEWHYCTRTGS